MCTAPGAAEAAQLQQLVGPEVAHTDTVDHQACARHRRCSGSSASEISAHPEVDEVVVFKDIFTAGLRFPLDSTVVDVFQLYKVVQHQMTLNSYVLLLLCTVERES